MAYLHEFSPDAIFSNTIRTHPQYSVTMYSGSMFINDSRFNGVESSSFDSVLRGNPWGNASGVPVVPTGTINLYELNVGNAREPASGDNEALSVIVPFLYKDGNHWSFKSVTSGTYAHAQPGTIIKGRYPLTSSISRELIAANGVMPLTLGVEAYDNNENKLAAHQESFEQIRKRMIALRNTLDYNTMYSPTFAYTGSLLSSNTIGTYETSQVNLLSIPSIFYSSGIKKGSVSLKFYVTGTLIDEVTDERENGELISITATSPVSGQVVGNILYNEGFILLTGSAEIGSADGNFGGDTYEFDSTHRLPRWTYFGAYASGNMGDYHPSASLYEVNFRGTNEIPTMTMFAEANAGEVNCSQNPSWISSSAGDWKEKKVATNQGFFKEPHLLEIKNTIQSDYCHYNEAFEKQVFISKIGIFDEHKNLIGIAKMANPVVKKETDDYTFKIKMDF